ncbi:MAG: helix-turn-helix domain-containing protein [Candidatus Limnocylindria bacterium]
MSEQAPSATVPRLTLRIEEAADSLGISRTALYPYLRSGAIRVVRFGRSVRIPLAELERYVAERTHAEGP